MKFTKLFAIYFLLALCGTAFGRSRLDPCIETANGIVPQTIDCITAESSAEDRRLNDLYQNLMRKLNDDRQAELRQAQRDWLRFRDSNSSFYYDLNGGQEAHVQSVTTYYEMTKSRADELQAILQQQEN